jgi:hypothetical protein
MRELAYIQQIKNLKPIPNADKIECAEILGWEVVVKKSDFKVGDLVVYVEIDSILPELSCFEFMRPRKFKVKTIKLKSQISQGIAFPLSIIKEVDPSFDLTTLKLGQDITEVLKITKYDPEAANDFQPEQVKKSWLANKYSFLKWKLFGIKPVKRGTFPSHLVPKTDETRVQKMGKLLEDREGQAAYIAEKLEGSSTTFVFQKNNNWLVKLFGKNYTFQICSRNMCVYNSNSGEKVDHYLIGLAEKYDILAHFKKLNRNLAIQGESVGGKIQGNIYKLPELQFYVFSIYDLDQKIYLPLNEMLQLLEGSKLLMVPMVDVKATIKNDIKYYVELSKGKSQLNHNTLREGIVVRGLNSDFSFKSINPEYLLKQN